MGTAQKAGPGEIFLLSALAKLGATVITYPLLLVKQRLMSASRHTEHDRRYKGTMHAIFKIWRDEGKALPAPVDPAFPDEIIACLLLPISAANARTCVVVETY